MIARFILGVLTISAFLMGGSCSSDVNTQVTKKDSAKQNIKPVDSTRKSVLFPKEMHSVRKSAFDEYTTRLGDDVYTCQYKGLCERSDTLGNRKVYLFNIKAEYLIDKVFLHVIDSVTFFVVWQETDHTGVGTNAALYKIGIDKPVWKHEYQSPDPGQIAIDGSFAYISTLGMVGKLNMFSGNYAWQHDSLFQPIQLRYKSFDKPLVYTSSVCFVDYPIRGRKNKRDSIWVNDETGKIIR